MFDTTQPAYMQCERPANPSLHGGAPAILYLP